MKNGSPGEMEGELEERADEKKQRRWDGWREGGRIDVETKK